MNKISVLLLLILFTITAQSPKVYVVLFTHIEENLPQGVMGTQASRDSYLQVREKLIDMAELAQQYSCVWVFQPDWKYIQAGLMYEDAQTMQNTNNKNLFRYLKEDCNVVIDPHSHEKQGYNYTDVAHLLDSVGVGATTVIGGHVWDPELPEFQEWDRFRVPVNGTTYTHAVWRGDILMGSGTPGHINDPLQSGIWRPKDKDNYFVDDPDGNIACIGKYKREERHSGVNELIELYANGTVLPTQILTASYHIKPAAITGPNGLAGVEDTIITPFTDLQNDGKIILTDFTSLIQIWETEFNGTAFIYDPVTAIHDYDHHTTTNASGINIQILLNSLQSSARILFDLPISQKVQVTFFTLRGCKIKALADREFEAGRHCLSFDLKELARGLYVCRFMTSGISQSCLVHFIE